MPAKPLNLSGLIAAIRLKTALLGKLATRPSTEWPDELARFIEAIEASDLSDTTALLVLLADLKEEIRVLTGHEGGIDVVSDPAVALIAPDASSKREILAEFRLEVAEWLRAPRRRTIVSSAVERLTRFIDEHYAERLTLDLLADAVGRSKRHVGMLFREQTGLTVHRYLTQVRVHHAAALIRRGEKIEAVSLSVGYRSKKNFYRHFKQQTGVTPVVYRTALVGMSPFSNSESAPEKKPKGH